MLSQSIFAFWTGVGTFCRAVSVVRAPLIAAILGAVVLSVPEQIIELYRVVGDGGFSVYSGAALVAGVAAALVLVYLAHGLVKTNGLEHCRSSNFGLGLLSLAPGLCGALLIFGFAFGLLKASCDPTLAGACANEIVGLPQDVILTISGLPDVLLGTTLVFVSFYRAAYIGLIVAAAVLLIGVLLSRPYRTWAENGLALSPRRNLGMFGWVRFLIIIALIAVPVVGYLVDPDSFAFRLLASLGAPAVIFLFIANLAYIGSFVTAWLDQFRVPAITALLLVALGISLFDRNDNHEIALIEALPQAAPSVNEAFEAWYAARKDRDHFKEKPYPVFIAATSGGGLYAAQHAGLFLVAHAGSLPGFRSASFRRFGSFGRKPGCHSVCWPGARLGSQRSRARPAFLRNRPRSSNRDPWSGMRAPCSARISCRRLWQPRCFQTSCSG